MSWWLVNASPDLAAQIEQFLPLQPQANELRTTPIAGVLLTNADVDHALGVLLMRQRDSALPIYTSDEIRCRLGWLEERMQPFCGIEWRHLPVQFVHLAEAVDFRGTDLGGSVAFQLRTRSGRRILIAPAVGAISGELADAIGTADAILFDGTFWSDEELQRVRPTARSASEMGHIPVEKSLPVLSDALAPRKIYIHINNTNPILTPRSRERTLVEVAGAVVGYDGLEFEL